MAETSQAKKKTTKRTHANKSARQFLRTASNIVARRAQHGKKHPNDSAARANWDRSPVRTSKK